MTVLEAIALGAGAPAVLFALGRAVSARIACLDEEARLAAAMPVGVALAGLAGMLAFVAGAPVALASFAVLAAAALALALERPGGAEGRWLLALAATGAFALAASSPLFAFGGGGASGDWVEHYERARWFLERGAGDALIGGYHVPARPPLVNAATAVCISLAGRGFPAYEAAAAALAAALLGPFTLVMRRYGPALTAGRRLAVALAALACAPLFVRDITYPWTKTVAAAFAILAIVLHLEGREGTDAAARRKTVVAFALAALGAAAHYSILLVVAPLALDLAILALRDRRLARPLLEAAAAASAILCASLAFSAATSGAALALRAPGETAAADLAPGPRLRAAVENAVDSVVPYFARGLADDGPIEPGSRSMAILRALPEVAVPATFSLRSEGDTGDAAERFRPSGLFTQERREGLLADRWLSWHSAWFPGAAGLGAVAALVAALASRLARALRWSAPGLTSEPAFWLVFAPPFALLAGGAVNMPCLFGVTFVSATPLALYASAAGTALALRLPAAARAALVSLQAVEALGVVLAAAVLFGAPVEVEEALVGSSAEARLVAAPSGLSALVEGQFVVKAERAIGGTLADELPGGRLASLAAGLAVAGAAVFLVRQPGFRARET